MSSINDLINYGYHVAPSRDTGECDEQYRERLRAYSLGMEVGMKQKQDEVDELQYKIDEALKLLNLAYPESCGYCVDEAINILTGEHTK